MLFVVQIHRVKNLWWRMKVEISTFILHHKFLNPEIPENKKKGAHPTATLKKKNTWTLNPGILA